MADWGHQFVSHPCFLHLTSAQNAQQLYKNHLSVDLLDPPRSKSPLFDELSIPFIDASLPPTPKTGRSQNALEILLGRRSLSSSDASLTGFF